MKQKSIIVDTYMHDANGSRTSNNLNKYLEEGWHVVFVCSMPSSICVGSPNCLNHPTCLVIIEENKAQ